MFTEYLVALRKALCDEESDTIEAYLIDADEDQPAASDEGIEAIAEEAIIAGPVTLTGCTVGADGSFDSEDFVFPSVPAGDDCEGVLLYNATAGKLMSWHEGVTERNGNNINVQAPSGGWNKLG